MQNQNGLVQNEAVHLPYHAVNVPPKNCQFAFTSICYERENILERRDILLNSRSQKKNLSNDLRFHL